MPLFQQKIALASGCHCERTVYVSVAIAFKKWSLIGDCFGKDRLAMTRGWGCHYERTVYVSAAITSQCIARRRDAIYGVRLLVENHASPGAIYAKERFVWLSPTKSSTIGDCFGKNRLAMTIGKDCLCEQTVCVNTAITSTSGCHCERTVCVSAAIASQRITARKNAINGHRLAVYLPQDDFRGLRSFSS